MNEFIKQLFVCPVDHHSCDADADRFASFRQERERRPNARFSKRKETFYRRGTNAPIRVG